MKQRDDRSDTSGASPKIKVERLSPRLETEPLSIVPDSRCVRDWLSSLPPTNPSNGTGSTSSTAIANIQDTYADSQNDSDDKNTEDREHVNNQELNVIVTSQIFEPKNAFVPNDIVVKEEPIDNGLNQISKRRTAVRKLDHPQIMDEEILQKVKEKALKAYNAYMDLNSILSPDMEIVIDLPKHVDRHAIHRLTGLPYTKQQRT
ncbi:4971_t:CDS:2 [Racocetra fulgida]|uniref:4971_t:CDS:1 n=1 Tax=Racocetra fulgida TaxID=60492 RepID=A0A9N9G6U6_9GLOM|nr:4971_t:CDS:2 [Racocetra fulgida]